MLLQSLKQFVLGFYCDPKFLVRKLFTKEDPRFLHKSLGLLALVSFVYRYFFVLRLTGNLGFDGSLFDWLTIALHMGLSASSMIFHVLARRILNKPMIIWKEYRLHAIVFTLRCCSVFAFARLRPSDLAGTDVEGILLWALVISHHLVVDEITRRFGPEDKAQTTVRCDGNSNLGTKIILRFYAFYQICALGSHLVPHTRLGDLGYNALVAIQSSAFLMTLFRKNLIRYYTHGLVYTACLVLSLNFIKVAHPEFLFWGKVCAAFLVRTQLRMNKYVIWTIFMVVSLPSVEIYLSLHLGALLEQGVPDFTSPLESYVDKAALIDIDGITALGQRTCSAFGAYVAEKSTQMGSLDYSGVISMLHSDNGNNQATWLAFGMLLMTAGYMGGNWLPSTSVSQENTAAETTAVGVNAN